MLPIVFSSCSKICDGCIVEWCRSGRRLFNDPLSHIDTGNLSAYRPSLCVSRFLVKLFAALEENDMFHLSTATARLCSPFRKGHLLVLSSEKRSAAHGMWSGRSYVCGVKPTLCKLPARRGARPTTSRCSIFCESCGWPTL